MRSQAHLISIYNLLNQRRKLLSPGNYKSVNNKMKTKDNELGIACIKVPKIYFRLYLAICTINQNKKRTCVKKSLFVNFFLLRWIINITKNIHQISQVGFFPILFAFPFILFAVKGFFFIFSYIRVFQVRYNQFFHHRNNVFKFQLDINRQPEVIQLSDFCGWITQYKKLAHVFEVGNFCVK